MKIIIVFGFIEYILYSISMSYDSHLLKNSMNENLTGH